MKIIIKTTVSTDYKTVFEKFDEKLLLYLTPVFPKAKLLRFDGSRKGDEVHLEIDFLFFKQQWNSLITEDGENGNELYFIDKGSKLPFFLKTWEHRHLVVSLPDGKTEIIDDIDFTTPFFLLDYLTYPLLYLQFAARIPKYKSYF